MITLWYAGSLFDREGMCVLFDAPFPFLHPEWSCRRASLTGPFCVSAYSDNSKSSMSYTISSPWIVRRTCAWLHCP